MSNIYVINRTSSSVVVGIGDGNTNAVANGEATIEPRLYKAQSVPIASGAEGPFQVCFIGVSGATNTNPAAWLLLDNVLAGATVEIATRILNPKEAAQVSDDE